MLRYRCNAGSTRKVRACFHNVAKLGEITKIEGIRYLGASIAGARITTEAVRVTGTKGTARFHGLLWGYSGEGPRGLRDLLLFIGFTDNFADNIMKLGRWFPHLGADWVVHIGEDRIKIEIKNEPDWVAPLSRAMVNPTPVSFLAK